jgi:small subunit ribosomal protein S20
MVTDMPITKSAKKALRQNVTKKAANDVRKKAMKDAVKAVKKDLTPASLSLAYKKIDKAAKENTIHKNRASRLKSRLAHRIAKSKSAVS